VNEIPPKKRYINLIMVPSSQLNMTPETKHNIYIILFAFSYLFHYCLIYLEFFSFRAESIISSLFLSFMQCMRKNQPETEKREKLTFRPKRVFLLVNGTKNNIRINVEQQKKALLVHL